MDLTRLKSLSILKMVKLLKLQPVLVYLTVLSYLTPSISDKVLMSSMSNPSGSCRINEFLTASLSLAVLLLVAREPLLLDHLRVNE